MRIVIDLQACQSGSRLGGIGRYSLALAKAIAAERRSHDLFVVLSDLLPRAEFDIRMEFEGLLEPDRILTFSAPGPVAASDPANAARTRAAELLREDFLRRLDPDIVHVSSLVEGWGDDVVTSVGGDDLAERTAVTWYDLIPYVQPEMYLRDKPLADHYHSKIDEARRAGLLLAISQYSRDEAVRELGLPEDRVVAISSAASDFFRPVDVADTMQRGLCGRLGITGPFLMYTGSFDIRKNQAALIEAFARTPSSVRDRHQLVIAGNGWDGAYASLREVARRVNLRDDRLVFTGHVDDDELLALYNLASLFVFPSLREGFGLPILEAMSCGTPCIGSNATSVPEVIGRDDAVFDPTNVDAIAGKITEAITDEGFRRELKAHALEHSKRFSWKASARRALDAMEAHAARIRHTDDAHGSEKLVGSMADVARDAGWKARDLAVVARSIARNEARTRLPGTRPSSGKSPRVGWVTPWGTRCGIASYSGFLVEASPAPPAAIFAERAFVSIASERPVGAFSAPIVPCWRAGDDDPLESLAKQVNSHAIDALVIQFNYGFFAVAALNAFLARQASVGRAVIGICHSTTDPPSRILSKRLADFAPGLAACDRVLVHSEKDIANLRQIGVHRNVSLFPHGIPVAPAEVPAAAPHRREFVLATYGFFLPHKGLLELIDAFGELARRDASLRLRMVNAEYSPGASGELISAARSRVRGLGLEDRVTLITDYLRDEESLAHLASADLVVFPYQHTGESSSAAVRIGLASGRPVAVTPLAIFDDVASVVHRLPGTDVGSLASGIGQLVARIRSGTDPDVASVAEAAGRWCESRSYPRVASQLHALLCQLGASEAGAA